MTRVARPLLRYHGGKWMLAPWIIEHFPKHRVYVEPFGGAGSVLLRKPRSKAEVYNDLDDDVINVFRVLRDPELAARLAEVLRLTPYARAEWALAFEPATDPIERARRSIVRAYMTFGTTSLQGTQAGFRATGWRTSGSSTAVQDWGRYPAAIATFTERLRHVLIEHRDAVEIIRQQDQSDTLFYVDPPYPVSTRTAVRHCGDERRAYAHNLTDDQHRALAVVLHAARGYVVLSGYPCDLYDVELFPDWCRVERQTTADGARKRTEVLWLNPACAAALDGHLDF